jgi:lysozyme
MGDLAEQLIASQEGRKPCVYRDTRGILTIAIGCVVDPAVQGAGLCDAAIDAQFAHDSAWARNVAAEFPNFEQLNEVRQAVLVSMAFQLGSKPLFWPNFMAALQKADYVAAAAAGLDSDWAAQTPARAKLEMMMLSSGAWQIST